MDINKQYQLDYENYIRQLQSCRSDHDSVGRMGRPEPILTDFSSASEAGCCSGHYFHQDLLVANKIFSEQPPLHLDMGSRIDGFITHLLSFNQNTILCDIRPLNYSHPCLSFKQLDITADIVIGDKFSFPSISSLHAVEHIGLGRYGDKVDPEGHIKAIKNISQLLAPNGRLRLSFPTGPSRVEFNSQRVISITDSLRIFEESGLIPLALHIVDDYGNLLPEVFSAVNGWGQDVSLFAGCAIWELTKK